MSSSSLRQRHTSPNDSEQSRTAPPVRVHRVQPPTFLSDKVAFVSMLALFGFVLALLPIAAATLFAVATGRWPWAAAGATLFAVGVVGVPYAPSSRSALLWRYWARVRSSVLCAIF